MKHEQLVQRATEAIKKLYGDTSVSQETTLDDLEELVEELEMLIETIECDIDNQS